MGKRRTPGDGSVFQRSDGRWCATIDLGRDPVSGKRRRKSIYARTKIEASRAARKAFEEHRRDELVVDDQTTVGVYLQGWLASLSARSEDGDDDGLALLTVQSYRSIVEKHLIPGIGHIKLSQLAPEHVEELLKNKASELSRRRLAMIRDVFRIALARALRRGKVRRNVAQLVELPPSSACRPSRRAVKKHFERDELALLLEAAQGDPLECLIHVALNTAARRGEVLALRWCDIDFDLRTISINAQIVRPKGGGYSRAPLKTASSRRTLRVAPEVIVLLKARRAQQREERLLAGDKWKGGTGQEDWFVFTTSAGTPLGESKLARQWVELLDRAGLPRVEGFHSLRHSAATLAVGAGVTSKAAQALLGHNDHSTTMRIYAHVFEDAVAVAGETLGDEIYSATRKS